MLKGVYIVLLAWILAQVVIKFNYVKDHEKVELSIKNHQDHLIKTKAMQLYDIMSFDMDQMMRDTLNNAVGKDSLYALLYDGIRSVDKEFVQQMVISMKTVLNEVYDLDSLKKTDLLDEGFEGQVVDILWSHIIEDDESVSSLPAGSDKFRKLLYNLVLNPGARKKGPFPIKDILCGTELMQFIYNFYESPFVENYLASRGIKLLKRKVSI